MFTHQILSQIKYTTTIYKPITWYQYKSSKVISITHFTMFNRHDIQIYKTDANSFNQLTLVHIRTLTQEATM